MKMFCRIYIFLCLFFILMSYCTSNHLYNNRNGPFDEKKLAENLAHFRKRNIPQDLVNYVAQLSGNSEFEDADGRKKCDDPMKITEGTTKQKASSIAQKAALEAKAASDAQNMAGAQAAHEVKSQLAEKALQAAKAAEAALSGKQAIVEQLEQEVREAESVVQEEGTSLQAAQANVQAAMQAAQQATTQLKTLTSAVQTAQANVGNSEQAAQGAQESLAEKAKLMESAKNRVEQLLRQLGAARSDYASTKQAAYKAAAAAHEAKVNASRNKRLIANAIRNIRFNN